MATKTHNPIEVIMEMIAKEVKKNPKNDNLLKLQSDVNKYVKAQRENPYVFVVKRSEDQQFYGVLNSRNNKVMDQTETMSRKQSVIKNFNSKQAAYSFAVIRDEK